MAPPSVTVMHPVQREVTDWDEFTGRFVSTERVEVRARVGGQLDSVNKTYYLTVTLSHTNNPGSGQVLTANSLGTTTNELMHFDGNLIFGNVGTTMNNLGAAPPLNPPGAGVIPTILNPVAGFVTAYPGYTYSGANVHVNLQVNGDAIVTSGSTTLFGPASDWASRMVVG